MAKGIRKPCKQCGADHHGFGEICHRCTRKNWEAARLPRVCPYCLVPRGADEPFYKRYHGKCSFAVSEISKRATVKVKKAIKSGLIQPISPETLCVDCGKPARDYDHRHYRKPLDVEPVCRTCNQKRGPALDLHSFYLEAAA